MKIEIRDSLLKDIKKIAKKDKEKLEYIYNQFLNAENINEIQKSHLQIQPSSQANIF